MENGKGSHLCDEERKERRRAANRKSARKSRFKENILLDELQKTVSQLSKQNDDLRADNDSFKRELMLLRSLIEREFPNQLSMPKQTISNFAGSLDRGIFCNSIGLQCNDHGIRQLLDENGCMSSFSFRPIENSGTRNSIDTSNDSMASAERLFQASQPSIFEPI